VCIIVSTQGIAMKEPCPKRDVSVKKALAMLKEKGVELDEKSAEKVLDFLYFLAKLTVNQIITNNSLNKKDNYEKGGFIRKGEH